MRLVWIFQLQGQESITKSNLPKESNIARRNHFLKKPKVSGFQCSLQERYVCNKTRLQQETSKFCALLPRLYLIIEYYLHGTYNGAKIVEYFVASTCFSGRANDRLTSNCVFNLRYAHARGAYPFIIHPIIVGIDGQTSYLKLWYLCIFESLGEGQSNCPSRDLLRLLESVTFKRRPQPNCFGRVKSFQGLRIYCLFSRVLRKGY